MEALAFLLEAAPMLTIQATELVVAAPAALSITRGRGQIPMHSLAKRPAFLRTHSAESLEPATQLGLLLFGELGERPEPCGEACPSLGRGHRGQEQDEDQ